VSDFANPDTEPVHDPSQNGELLEVQQAGARPDGKRPISLVDGLAEAGESVVLGAGRATGKSWWAMDLARLLALGHGRFIGTLTVQRPAKVLYCHGELDPWGAYDRWERLNGGEPLPPLLLETFERWRIRVVHQRVTSGPTMTTEFHEAVLDGRIETTIAALAVEVLILDPWAVYYAGRENSNDEAEAALDKLRDLQLRHGLTVVVLHHFGNTNDARDPEDLWRGASRLADWASTRVTLRPHYTDKQARDQGMNRHQARRFADVTILRRSAAPTDDFSVAWNPQTGQWERWRSPQVAADEQRTSLHPVDVAGKCPPDGWPSMRAAAAALNISPTTASHLLEQATAAGLIQEYVGPRGARGFRLSSRLSSSHRPTLPMDSHETATDQEQP
jgi:AAA domain